MLMEAVTIDEFGSQDKLHFEHLPVPKPKANEVLIQIAYTSVNPVDWKIREGMLKDMLPHQFPLILGWDAAGTIAQVGSDVHQFKVGDKVFAYCRKPTVQNGTYAEYIACQADAVALKPKKLSFAEAASIPLVGLTAWQALIEHAQLKPGQSILITGGAGGVGSLAIEIAKYLKADVYTTASKENHPYVKKLGAKVAIDYRNDNVAKKIKTAFPAGLDVILDCVGGKTLAECYQMLKPGGKLVTIAGKIDKLKASQYEIDASFCFVTPSGAQLAEIGKLIQAGKLKVPNIEEMNLSQAAEAQEKNRKGHTRGKIVLKVSDKISL